jgi:hypothetical protein
LTSKSELIALKVYNTRNEVMVAACDSELLGKTFEDGDYQIQVSPEFYEDVKVRPENFISHLSEATIINLVGERVIDHAIKAGLVEEDGVIRIKGIPHAQIFRME